MLVVTGTGTGVGKTVVVAGVAALAVAEGRRVAVLKPAQTGLPQGAPGDVHEVRRLVGAGALTVRELHRYPDPLAPQTAARRSGWPEPGHAEVAAAVSALAAEHDLVLVEGTGGLLSRFRADGMTVADVAWAVSAPALVVTGTGLDALSTTALTTEVLVHRGLEPLGVVIGRWPADPDLAARCALADLPECAGTPLAGVLPEGMAGLAPAEFRAVARESLSPWFGGVFDPEVFAAKHHEPGR
ncbi:dethiobiotin synthetase [Goodfellowiella coeruleoviolacea]|uniref:ATP-dependent dethiobiotin synthetase BioD n=1 Tax=Goodfellowiella coeruleoviolacea TaxID=334858 RepID=A0AAE3KIQ3_9PSEU|nr:dethiobiotin synthetase [Goodfellowiella coeruleoviolacea]